MPRFVFTLLLSLLIAMESPALAARVPTDELKGQSSVRPGPEASSPAQSE